MSRPRLFSLIAVIAIAVWVLDRATKIYVVEILDLRRLGAIDVMPPFLNLRMAWNTGINFGIPLGGPLILVGLSVVISAGLTWWVLSRRSRAMGWGAGLVVGGALGNAFDRVWYPEQAVADFINNACCAIDNPFAYNVADVAIFAGAIWIALKA